MKLRLGVSAVGPGLVACLLLLACSDFDPKTGARRTEVTEELSDAGGRDKQPTDAELPEGSFVLPGEVSFRRDVRPLMDRPLKDDPTGKGCKGCHYTSEANHVGLDLGGLNLTTLKAMREGGGSSGRRLIVPGKPSESGLVQKLKGQYPYGARMPKNGPPFWTDAEMKLVSDWILQGAKGADDE